MSDQTVVWSSPDWLAEATDWIDERPEHVPAPMAVDVARSWVLLPDGGPSLGDRVGSEDLAATLCEVLPQYAELVETLELAVRVGPSHARTRGCGRSGTRPTSVGRRRRSGASRRSSSEAASRD